MDELKIANLRSCVSLQQVISQAQTYIYVPDAVPLHIDDFQWKRKLSLTRAQSIVSGVR